MRNNDDGLLIIFVLGLLLLMLGSTFLYLTDGELSSSTLEDQLKACNQRDGNIEIIYDPPGSGRNQTTICVVGGR